MKVRVRRYGGQLPGLQPERVLDLVKLGADTAEAVEELIKRSPPKPKRIPDAYSYEFVVENSDGSSKTLTVSEMDVPEALLKHLP